MNKKVIAIVPSAGIGKRFDTSRIKTFVELDGMPILAHTLKRLQCNEIITEIIPALRGQDIDSGFEMAKKYNLDKIIDIAPGGNERQDSIYNALKLIESKMPETGNCLVLIHDGVRPFIPEGTIEKLVDGIEGFDGILPGIPSKDTLKQVDRNNVVISTVDRENIRAVQTPQVFYFDTIKSAYDKAYREGFYATDDAALVERMGGRVKIIPGSPFNIKVTTPEDLGMLEYVLKNRGRGA